MPASVRSSRWTEPLLFVAATSVYAGIGIFLSLQWNLVDGDGPSRVADASYVLFTRNPHLGAIGFVWNPLPSLVEIPLLMLKGWWPELQSRGLAGSIQSGLFMAGAVLQVRRITLDRFVSRSGRWVLVSAFALNPMIIIFGGNALSEAALLFCTIWATRRLMLWLRTDNIADLMVCGLALGVSYTARYEALASAIGAVFLVAAVSSWRRRPSGSSRGWRGLGIGPAAHDVLVVGAPIALSFLAWSTASWLLTGQVLAQFSSQYGNSSQVAGVTGTATNRSGGGLLPVLHAVVAYEPLLPLALVGTAVLAIRRRQLDVLAPIFLLGTVLGFEAVAQLAGLTFGWFRFYLCSVPLMIVVVATLWDPKVGVPVRARSRRRHGHLARSSWVLGLTCLALLGPSLPSTWAAMLNPEISNQFDQLGLHYLVSDAHGSANQQPDFQSFQDTQAIAAFLDQQHLPRASVLSDAFQSWPIWLASRTPQQFVMTSDFDFLRILNAPARNRIRYILISNPINETVDAINRRYPSLWKDGAGLGTLLLTVRGRGNQQTWRIYAITPNRV